MKRKLISSLLLLTMLFSLILPPLPAAAADATISTDKTTYTVGEPILVTASSANTSGKDWIGITVKGDKTGAAIYWDYLSDATPAQDIRTMSHTGKGREAYLSLPAGEYTVFLMPNDHSVKSGYDLILAKVDITIVAAEQAPVTNDYIKTDKTEYIVGEPIMVSASSANASGKDWVGIWPRGEMGASIYWEYLADIGKDKAFDIRHAAHSGSSRSAYFGIPAGEYTLYLIPNDLTGNNGIPVALATVDITVKDDPNRVAKAPLSADYKLKNATDGMADGTLTIKLPTDHGADDIYMWWGDATGKQLVGYTRLARFKVTGTTVVHQMTANTKIPAGAETLIIYTYNESNGLSKECLVLDLPDGAASKEEGELLSEFQIVSDIHIRAGAEDEYSKNFLAMLRDVAKNSPDSQGIFTVGDNVDRGDTPQYWTFFHNLYQSVKDAPPLYLGMGNHELIGTDYKTGLESFLKNVELPDGTTPALVNYDCWVNGYHYVFIGSDSVGAAAFSQTQLTWLRETLAENRDGRPIFLFLHQPMLNTVSGSSSAEGWSGVANAKDLKDILNEYPEVLMFNGHTHWILDSDNCMYDGGGTTASIFNTSSVAYLWHSYYIATGERMLGSEGYYIRVYRDRVEVLGRNFQTGEWVSSAQFVVSLSTPAAQETPVQTETTATTTNAGEATEQTPSTEPTTLTDAQTNVGVSGIIIAVVLIALAAGGTITFLLIQKRK